MLELDYVVLATRSREKLEALRGVLRRRGICPRRGIYRADVDSGVDESPSGEDEIWRGAKHRAEGACAAWRRGGRRRLFIGMETGVKPRWGGWAEQCLAHCILVTGETRLTTTAGSSEFALPASVASGLERGLRHRRVVDLPRGRDTLALYTHGAKRRRVHFAECLDNAVLQLRGSLLEEARGG